MESQAQQNGCSCALFGAQEQPFTCLFLSVDIAGSTRLKGTHSIVSLSKSIEEKRAFLRHLNDSGIVHLDCNSVGLECLFSGKSVESLEWAEIIRVQFEEFHAAFSSRAMETLQNVPQNAKATLSVSTEHIWKCLGDEILYAFIVCSREEVFALSSAFLHTLRDFDAKARLGQPSDSKTQLLRMKGTGWVANFPTRNRSFKLFGRDDYFGPDMDIGFRISKFARPGLLCVSLDLAYLLAWLGEGRYFRAGIVAWEQLKGVWNDLRYPVIWVAPDDYSIGDAVVDFPDWENDCDARSVQWKKSQEVRDGSRLSSESMQGKLKGILAALSKTLNISIPFIVNKSEPLPDAEMDIFNLMGKIPRGQSAEQTPPPVPAEAPVDIALADVENRIKEAQQASP